MTRTKGQQERTPIDSAIGVGAGLRGVRSPHDSTVAPLTKLGGKPGLTEKASEKKAETQATPEDQ